MAEESSATKPRTPLFEAQHQQRYIRQYLVGQIEQLTGRRLLVYCANVENPFSGIGVKDVVPFQDLLCDCDKDSDIDLMLQTNGGDPDVAEKLVYMLRERAASLRLIVAERAKSAGTLIALAADEILMGTPSELGPIDPQVTLRGPDGNFLSRPAHSFLDGLEDIKRKVIDEGGQINPAYFPLLSHFDPAALDVCNKAIKRCQQFAAKWLKRHMLRGQPASRAQAIAKKLVAQPSYIQSHGTVIDWEEAQQLGLRVTHLRHEDPLWDFVWRLYVQYHQEFQTDPNIWKIFETNRVSVVLP